MIDLGLAKEFSEAERRKNAKGLPLGGTRRFASIRNHNGRGRSSISRSHRSSTEAPEEQSRADDLESLGYVFVYFARGSLPWQGLTATTDQEKEKRIKERKETMSAEALCDDVLPREFARYIDYSRSLGFDDRPDYAYLRGLFGRLFTAEGFQHDDVFDWTEKRFHAIYGHADGSASTEALPIRRRSNPNRPKGGLPSEADRDRTIRALAATSSS